MTRYSVLAIVCSILVLSVATHADAQTLATVKQRGVLVCGSDGARPGISAPDSRGVWSGFEVSFCRAIAAAIFSDTDKVRFVPLSTVQRFPALQSGEIDLLARSTTVNLSRDSSLGFDFSPITMYAATSFMTYADTKAKSGKDLDGATVCVPPGASAERNISDFAQKHKITLKPLVIQSPNELNETYLSRRCDVMANFLPGLATIRAYQAPKPEDHIILPDIIAKEPLAIAVRQGDPQWRDLVTWVVYATIEAEERGITSANVDQSLTSNDPEVQRFLGVNGELGEKLGVRNDFAYQIVKKVGNYGEIWDNTVGKKSPLKLDRGLNALWTDGGLMYAMPFQ